MNAEEDRRESFSRVSELCGRRSVMLVMVLEGGSSVVFECL